jgi:hypothetical protein
MKSHASGRTGILIVRVWKEASARGGFRARITQTLDSTGVEEPTATAESEPEDVYPVVRTWMEAFVEQETPSQ